MNYDFHKDLEIAHQTELDIAQYFIDRGAELLEHNDDNRYDLKILYKNKIITIEIKEDFRCGETGNIPIEYSCRGKSSGISVSKADVYIYKCNLSETKVKYLLMTTKDLKKAIVNTMYSCKVNGGDKGSNSLNFLFRLDFIESISKELFL